METEAEQSPGRLPSGLRPESYELELRVDPEEERFSGRVRIRVKTDRPLGEIAIHALELDIAEARVAGRAVGAGRIRRDGRSETARLRLEEPLPPGKAVIELSYSGPFNRQMRGLYLSTAKHDGKPERYAFTQFEPTSARRMFPCFDEPELKARFALTVVAPARLTVLSNQPPEARVVEGDRQTVRFSETPAMSSYLLALAVARLTPVSRSVEGVMLTVWTRPEDARQGAFALDAAQASLIRLNRYFGLPYQLPKLDLVAVPDFAAGAMENWGAIFFRDSALLADPELSSTRALRRIAEVVAHEIVHQWFGNLVTMKWWDDLWLNEAFATWLAFKVVDDWKPAWRSWLDFEARKRRALGVDALRGTRPVIAPARDSDEIEAQFDALSYEKGGAFLRMLEGYLGEEPFRRGIQAYMRRHRYGNTVAADLWRALEEASGEPVARLAEDWLTKPGYPVVALRVVSAERRAVELSQRRFDAHGAPQAPSAWTVPVVVRYRLEGERRPRVHRVLLEGRREAALPGRAALSWAYPNVEEAGFYRVAPEPATLARLRRDWRALAEVERAGLLNHLWARVKNGELAAPDFLDTAMALRGDASRLVVEDLAAYVRRLETLVRDADRPAFARAVGALFGPHWRRLGWEARRGETDDDKLRRAAALSALSVAPSRGLAAQAELRLRRYLERPESLDPTLASPLLELGARRGGPKRFEAYRRGMAAATTPERRDLFLTALGDFLRPALARKLVDLSLTDAVRGQDLWRPLGSLLDNPAVRGHAWKRIRERWAEVREKAGSKGATRVIEGLAAFDEPRRLAEIRAFFARAENRVPSAERALEQTLESIELAIRFRRSQAKALSAWLRR